MQSGWREEEVRMMMSCVARVTRRLTVCGAVAAASMFVSAPVMAASCESVAKVKLADGRIDAAQTVAAGAFTVPGEAGSGASNAVYKKLPAFCRVTATLTPSSDSDIKVEVWLPVAGWNKKFQAAGNGGWAGSISY
jgi:feruloyl esterase